MKLKGLQKRDEIMSDKNMTLDEIRELDKKYYMNTFGERTPLCFTEGKGIELTATDGKVYKDFFAGIAVNCLGYGHKRLTEELIAHYRALMLAALPGGQSLLSGVSPEEEALYLEKGPQLGQREAIRAIRTLGTALEHMTRGSDQRIELELALFSLSEPPQQRQTVPVQGAPVARAAQPAAVQPFASAPAVQPFVSAPVQQAPVQQPVVEPAPLPEPLQPAAEGSDCSARTL